MKNVDISGQSLNYLKNDFFLPGKVGDWERYYTAVQSQQIDDVCKKVLQPHGLTFTYRDSWPLQIQDNSKQYINID